MIILYICWTVLVLLLSCAMTKGFFDFLRPTSPATVIEEDPHPVRGVPDYLTSRYYEIDVFKCDEDGTTLNISAINDGYCDCADGTDEPGTSACEKGIFHCRNKGFKVTKLPSSRVDDQICDCCDGSDEGIYVKCPNTCKQAAEKERGALERMVRR